MISEGTKIGSPKLKCDELQYERLGKMMSYFPCNTLVIRKQFVDAAIDELKQINTYKENVGKRWFDRCMEARALWVKNTRAMWQARAIALARFNVLGYLAEHKDSHYWYDNNCFNQAQAAMRSKIDKALQIIQAKAEEYK